MKKVSLSRDVEGALIWCAALGFTVAMYCAYRLVWPLDIVPAPFMWLGLIVGLCEIAFVIRSVYFETSDGSVGREKRPLKANNAAP